MALAGQLLVRRAETSRTNRELKSAGGGFPVFPTPCIVANLAPGIAGGFFVPRKNEPSTA
jgi:hypothetical protein